MIFDFGLAGILALNVADFCAWSKRGTRRWVVVMAGWIASALILLPAFFLETPKPVSYAGGGPQCGRTIALVFKEPSHRKN